MNDSLKKYFDNKEDEIDKNSWDVFGCKIRFPPEGCELSVVKEQCRYGVINGKEVFYDLAIKYKWPDGEVRSRHIFSEDYKCTPELFIHEFNLRRKQKWNSTSTEAFNLKLK